MFKFSFLFLTTCLLSGTFCSAQFPSATEEHKVFQQEVGSWDIKVKLWANGPNADPVESVGSEKNVMMGDMWLVTDYKGDFSGQAFSGHGVFGYDPEKKKYIGMWVDSMMPTMAVMEGDYDKSKRTMTYVMEGKGPDGKPQKTKLVTVFKVNDTRVMTMSAEMDGKFVKMMEMDYTRAKK